MLTYFFALLSFGKQFLHKDRINVYGLQNMMEHLILPVYTVLSLTDDHILDQEISFKIAAPFILFFTMDPEAYIFLKGTTHMTRFALANLGLVFCHSVGFFYKTIHGFM